MAYSIAASLKLTPAEIEERRRQLGRAGLHAWLSPLVVLVAVYILRRYISQHRRDSARLRRLLWTLQTPIPYTWPVLSDFGNLATVLLGAGYGLWLAYLTTRNTGSDYMHVTKALGHVGVSQLPWQYLLSVKDTRFSPVAWATGLTHERLNAVHRLFGRIVHVMLAAHALLYLRFFALMGFLPGRLKDRIVQMGILAFWSFNFLAILALPGIRRRVYHAVFYRSHVVLSALVMPALWFHVPYTRWFVVQMGAVYVLSGVSRFAITKGTVARELKVQSVKGTGLIKVTFGFDKESPLVYSVPGQHVYVVSKGSRMISSSTKTPLTIAKISDAKEATTGWLPVGLTLVARNMGGPGTSYLASLAATAESDSKSEASKNQTLDKKIQIEGPYGEAGVYMPAVLENIRANGSSGPALLIAGGIGATYTISIYLALLNISSTSTLPQSKRGGLRKFKLVWLVKTAPEAAWGLEILSASPVSDLFDVEIYITKSSTHDSSRESGAKGFPPALSPGIQIHDLGRRPDMKTSVVDDFFTSTAVSQSAEGDDEPVSVFICGPPALSRDVRRAVDPWVLREGRDVRWFEETFGFGG